MVVLAIVANIEGADRGVLYLCSIADQSQLRASFQDGIIDMVRDAQLQPPIVVRCKILAG